VVDDEQPRDAAQADKGEGDDRLPPPWDERQDLEGRRRDGLPDRSAKAPGVRLHDEGDGPEPRGQRPSTAMG